MARYVFRALNEEDIARLNSSSEKLSIVAKNPNDTRYSIRNFVKNGRLRSKFIAMTDSIGVADIKYGTLPGSKLTKRDSIIIMVDLDKLDESRIHYSPAAECDAERTDVRDMAIYGTEADNEVIYEGELPADSYHEIHPLLVDIMTGYDMSMFGGRKYEPTDKICEMIAEGKSEKLIKDLLKNVSLNPIEKEFVEKYYGLIIGDDGNVSINPDRNQPLKGDMEGVEKHLAECFHIVGRNGSFKPGLLGRCIQTNIIERLNYTEAKITPLPHYTSPNREKISPRNMSEGRYHINHLDLTENKKDKTGTRGRRLGDCLYYTDRERQSSTLDRAIALPYKIEYKATPEGYVGIHIFTKYLGYDSNNQVYDIEPDGFGRDKIHESIYMGSFARKQEVPTKQFLETALGDMALTASEVEQKVKEERQLKLETEKREAEIQKLKAAKEKGDLPPEIVEEFLRKVFCKDGTKMLSVDDTKMQREVYLLKNKSFERFATETVFDTPLSFRTKSGKKPVQTFTISRIPTRKRNKKGRNGEIIECYVPEDEKEFRICKRVSFSIYLLYLYFRSQTWTRNDIYRF